MGYYIEVYANKGKAQMIVDGKVLVNSEPAPSYEAKHVTRPATFGDIPEGKALICVVDNGLFEAAGYVYDEAEFREFSFPDGRPRTWVLMDKDVAEVASGRVNKQPQEVER